MALSPFSDRLIRELVDDANRQGLVLFIGAGVSAGVLDTWNGLLEALLTLVIKEAAREDCRVQGNVIDRLLRWCKCHFDVCAQASIVQHVLERPERYRLEIQDALYGRKPNIEDEVKDYCRARRNVTSNARPDDRLELLLRVAELSCLPQVRCVVTFNFDTLLEFAISACGKRPRPFYGRLDAFEGEGLCEDEIPVYYVHGRLPPPQMIASGHDKPVVLSLDEYFNRNADPHSWETATLLHLLRTHATLWLGTSFRDWDMMKVLHAAQSGRNAIRAYCLQCLREINKEDLGKDAPKDEEEWSAFQGIAMRFQATLFDAIGMRLVLAGDDFPAISATIAQRITNPLVEAEQRKRKSPATKERPTP